MVAARRIIALSVDADQRRALVEVARSRTEPANRVERAGIILAYLDEPSAYAVARAMGVSQQTVTRCLQRAAELGVLAALDDRARTGREARITAEARTWLVGLACARPTQFGYPHELWTTRLLAAHARDHGPDAGHPSLANLAQGTVCKILAAHEVRPHKSLPSRRRGCVTTWSGAIPSLSQKWRRSCAFTARSRCAGRRAVPAKPR
jgi:transposase